MRFLRFKSMESNSWVYRNGILDHIPVFELEIMLVGVKQEARQASWDEHENLCSQDYGGSSNRWF